LEQLKTISEEDHAKVKNLAAIVRPLRSVIHKTPDDYGMSGWRDLYIPSDDGAPLRSLVYSGQRPGRRQVDHLQSCAADVPCRLSRPSWRAVEHV
jgi:hypothetical protein